MKANGRRTALKEANGSFRRKPPFGVDLGIVRNCVGSGHDRQGCYPKGLGDDQKIEPQDPLQRCPHVTVAARYDVRVLNHLVDIDFQISGLAAIGFQFLIRLVARRRKGGSEESFPKLISNSLKNGCLCQGYRYLEPASGLVA